MSKNQHVVPRDGQWIVRGDTSPRPSGVFRTQGDAIGHARERARSRGGELVIHGRDGRIREKTSYDRDLAPRKE